MPRSIPSRRLAAGVVASIILFSGLAACSGDDGDGADDDIEQLQSTVSSAASQVQNTVTSIANQVQSTVTSVAGRVQDEVDENQSDENEPDEDEADENEADEDDEGT